MELIDFESEKIRMQFRELLDDLSASSLDKVSDFVCELWLHDNFEKLTDENQKEFLAYGNRLLAEQEKKGRGT
jgi:hypothetical protein